jgi:sialic acid synthase SpsE
MSEIILDFGSGNTAKNNKPYIKRMIDELKAVDTGKHTTVIKWQLFQEAGQNIPLTHMAFDYAYTYAKELGYKTTASVFDIDSLKFLLKHEYELPFVKIANRRDLDWIIGEVPRKVKIYISIGSNDLVSDYANNEYTYNEPQHYGIYVLCCISKYPAKINEYLSTFQDDYMINGISDHTIGLGLFKHYYNRSKEWPLFFEKHYKLPDSTGLDAGPFASTPEELREIL